MKMPGRYGSDADGKYSFGFNGMRMDDEMYSQEGNSYGTEYRQLDVRIGRWLSTDPVTHHHFSPYSTFDNNPIYYADPTGADSEGDINKGDCESCSTDPKTKQGTLHYDDANDKFYSLEGTAWKEKIFEQTLREHKVTSTYSVAQRSAIGAQMRHDEERGFSMPVERDMWVIRMMYEFARDYTPIGTLGKAVYNFSEGNIKEGFWNLGETALFFVGTGAYKGIWQGGKYVFYSSKAAPVIALTDETTIVTKTLSLTDEAMGGAKAFGSGTNVVYKGVDAAGKVRYVGITSLNPEIRWGVHEASFGTGKEFLKYTVIPNATNLSRKGARFLEQTLINNYGLGKNGGLLLNKINSISPLKWGGFGL